MLTLITARCLLIIIIIIITIFFIETRSQDTIGKIINTDVLVNRLASGSIIFLMVQGNEVSCVEQTSGTIEVS